jgi:hypothetical protein
MSPMSSHGPPRDVKFLSYRRDNAGERVFFEPNFHIGIGVAPKGFAIGRGRIGQGLVDAVEGDRPPLPPGMIDDPAIWQPAFPAHGEKIALNPVIAAFVFGDGAANGCEIEDLADGCGLRGFDDGKQLFTPLDEPRLRGSKPFRLFIR